MKRTILILVFLTSLSTIAQIHKSKADEALKNLIEKNLAVGAVAGYAINNEVIWQSARGYANKEKEIEFKVDTKVRMASIAKPMTALAILQLWEAGKLDLDTPIQTYIPEYPKQPKAQITTRHLLSHTSGIAGYRNNKDRNNTKEYETLTDALEIFKNRELLFEPGTRYSYTTYGFTVLGVVIERVSGMDYEDYMRQHIWDMAEMTETGVVKFEADLQNASGIYTRKGGKAKEGFETNLSDRVPGGGLYTTVTDLLKFGNAVINNVFVKQETLNFMREHHSLEKEGNAYGFGWFYMGLSQMRAN